MKSNIGKKINKLVFFRNKFRRELRAALLITLLVLLNGISLLSVNLEEDNMNNTTRDNQLDPLMSAPQFVGVTKSFTSGTQGNTWNPLNLENNDGTYDQTNYELDSPGYILHDVTSSNILQATGVWGTVNPRVNYDPLFPNFLKNDDGLSLFLDNSAGGVMHLEWGYYSNFDASIHAFTTEIRVYYKILVQQWQAVSLQWLAVHAHTANGYTVSKTLAQYPITTDYYTGYIVINSGNFPDAFNSIKNGDYIDTIEVTLHHEKNFWGSNAYIYVDYIDIQYYIQRYKANFYYNLDYSTYNIGSIDGFDVNIDLYDTTPGVGIHLYNFHTLAWDKFTETTSWHTEFITFHVGTDPQYYFNVNDHLYLAFWRPLFNDIGHAAIDMVLKVDWVEIDIPPPEPPSNVLVDQGIEHIFLNWNQPNGHGLPIVQYNVYRGTIQGGSKSLLASPVTSEFNDTTAVVGTQYYYIITAETVVGEGDPSNEVSGKARDAPFVQWMSPDEGAEVILPMGDAVFEFLYDWVELDDVKLDINGIDFGSVWNTNSTILSPYTGAIDGPVTATLYGYNNSILVAQDSHNFYFSKLTYEVYALLDTDTEYMGTNLYLILHDPNGDNSYSGFSETTALSLGVGAEITAGVGGSVDIGEDVNLFGVEVGASLKVSLKTTVEAGFDFRFEITDKTELTSNQDSSNPNYIGPGNGDRYWGEAWTFRWELRAYERQFFNGTHRFDDPKFHYGIIRGGEVFLNDVNAPTNWRNRNPVHNGWNDVLWIPPDPLTVDGGAPISNTFTVTETLTAMQSISIDIDTSATVKVPGLETSVDFSLGMKSYVETGQVTTFETSYTIYDDEPTDVIVQRVGIDKNFGSFIFNTSSFFCETSQPLENNTFDYVPPLINFPQIDLDTNDDGLAPSKLDSPMVTVDIVDEGGIQIAIVMFSNNGGINWDSAILSEQLGNPGTWEGTIPAHPRGTGILWYIKAWDNEGSNSTRKNIYGEPYNYVVINTAPNVSVVTPNGGEKYGNSVSIEWTMSDLDSDPLSCTIFYNIANTGWVLLAEDVSGTTYLWDTTNITYANSVLIKVIVNDGYGGIVEDESDWVFQIKEPPAPPFEIPGSPPVITILFTVLSIVAVLIVIHKKKTFSVI